MKSNNKEKVIIYGVGNFFRQNEKNINNSFQVEAFVDIKSGNFLDDKKIVDVSEIGTFQYDKIVIMIWNLQECIKVAKMLNNEYQVDYRKIELGVFRFPSEIYAELDDMHFTEDGKISITVGEFTLKVASLDEFNNACEVLVEKVYSYYINNDRKDVVIDVGMNIGDATLFFLKQEQVKKVFAYEPFMKTFVAANENLKEYIHNTEKLQIYQYGISDRNEFRNVMFNEDMTCGQSTISDTREKSFDFYQSTGLVSVENEKIEQIEVRNASEIFEKIIAEYKENNIVLKMDCEGEEYAIVENLYNNSLLGKISFIMLEWHYRGKDDLLKWLKKSGFSYWHSEDTRNMGMIYAVNTKVI